MFHFHKAWESVRIIIQNRQIIIIGVIVIAIQTILLIILHLNQWEDKNQKQEENLYIEEKKIFLLHCHLHTTVIMFIKKIILIITMMMI